MNAGSPAPNGCAAQPWIAEPTRAGWWVAWIYSSPKMLQVAELCDREGLHVFWQGFWRTPREVHAAGWAGPIESPSASDEETRHIEKLTFSAPSGGAIERKL